jgi:SAD/SRA domain
VLNPYVGQINSKTHGHNGLTMGQISLRQLAALAYGAHGSSQSGVAGTPSTGAFSIIVTGRYRSVEKDGLARFDYCAPGSMNNSFAGALIESQGLKTMRASRATRRPVRVLRGPNEDFAEAPRAGLRYDGLYVVVREERRTNKKGGLYAAFVLERMRGQAAVDLPRPNAADLEFLAQLKEKLGGV